MYQNRSNNAILYLTRVQTSSPSCVPYPPLQDLESVRQHMMGKCQKVYDFTLNSLDLVPNTTVNFLDHQALHSIQLEGLTLKLPPYEPFPGQSQQVLSI